MARRAGARDAEEGSVLWSSVRLKILFWDGNRLCLFTKRLDHASFVWPVMAGFDGSITLTPAQLAMLIEGIDWRAPERVWRPALAG
jgi:transposase